MHAAVQPNNMDLTLCQDKPNEFLVGSSHTACDLKRLPLRLGGIEIASTDYILVSFFHCGPSIRHVMIKWPNIHVRDYA